MAREQKEQGDTFSRTPSSGSSDPRAISAHHATSKRWESNIFGLPRKIRNDIYEGVLYVPHPLYLFQDTGSRVETFAPERPRRWLALLQVNRQTHREAADILFRTNIFALLDERQPQDSLLGNFLTCIGPVNSASLSHLSMDFPSLEGSTEGVKLKDHSLQRLKLLQGCCTNLTTVEVSLGVMQIRALDGMTGESQQLMKEALSQINSQLQAIPSLKTIIVRITGSNPAPLTLECMRTMGWTILPAYGGTTESQTAHIKSPGRR
jgi:hypothetical protein